MELQQKINKVYEPVFTKKPRYIILMGGRGAGRSTVASQRANSKLVSDEYYRCAIMRYVLGDIRNSIYREILDRAEENKIKDSLDVNDSLMSIKYGLNTINAVGFRKSSADQKAKLKSLANYNEVIIEEADETPEADFTQLDDTLRTIKGDITIILLLNPPAKNHWIIQRWFDLEPSEQEGYYTPKLKPEITDTLFIRTDYKDNLQNIDLTTRVRYENYRKSKPDHYWNMIKGLVPETIKGRIYKNWKIVDSIPHEARLLGYGMDFGYTTDPTAIVALYYYNNGYILDEITYQTGLKNHQIAGIFNATTQALVIADSAEPKSIDEIKEAGVTILPADKGADSVAWGIDQVQSLAISVTKRSKNILKEVDEYAWKETKDGEQLNIPKGGFDHAMDAIRYAITMLVKNSSMQDVKKKQNENMNRNQNNAQRNSTK